MGEYLVLTYQLKSKEQINEDKEKRRIYREEFKRIKNE